MDFDIKYNANKSNIMIVRSKDQRKLNVCDEIKYLGHHLVNDLSDVGDINRQCCDMYAQAKMLVCKFSICSVNVKVALFRAFCSLLYAAHLQHSYRKSNIQSLNVACNDGMRLLTEKMV